MGRIRDACRDLEKNHSLYDLATKYDWDEYWSDFSNRMIRGKAQAYFISPFVKRPQYALRRRLILVEGLSPTAAP